ncbi:Tubulin gamma chain [Verticillium dahliae VDG1]|nr:Tubulin gamma chain [Verticillium dahliae VDG1]
MLKIASIVHGICLSLLIGMVEGIDQAVNPTLVGRLKLSPTELDKIKLLSQDSDWTFDYFASDFHNYSPGGVVNANAATFPATIGNGMTMSWLTLGPCAMLPPHYHPRASNYVVAVEGTTETFMTLENGARLVRTILTPGKMTIFPTGSLHTMQNTGRFRCENATLVSALSSEDAGTHNVANGLFGLPSEILAAAFGDSPLATQFAALAQNIPAVGTGASEGSSECMRRCEGGPSF